MRRQNRWVGVVGFRFFISYLSVSIAAVCVVPS